MCRGRRARNLIHLHIQREKIVLRGSRAGRRFGCRNHPSCVYVLGRRTRRERGGRTIGPENAVGEWARDERVCRGQASERAVCVCEAVSVEKGARRPPLPTAVVCTHDARVVRNMHVKAGLLAEQREAPALHRSRPQRKTHSPHWHSECGCRAAPRRLVPPSACGSLNDSVRKSIRLVEAMPECSSTQSVAILSCRHRAAAPCVL